MKNVNPWGRSRYPRWYWIRWPGIWQLLVASGAGMLLNKWIFNVTGLDLPTYLVAFLIAIVMFLVFKKVGVSKYVDENVISRISGTATDYLVFSNCLHQDFGNC